jgi:hypothetical protein
LPPRAAAIPHGTNQTKLSMALLKQFSVFHPTPDRQRPIVTVFRALDTKATIDRNVQTSLQALFRTLLHQLTTASIHVHDLDLSALELTDAPPPTR